MSSPPKALASLLASLDQLPPAYRAAAARDAAVSLLEYAGYELAREQGPDLSRRAFILAAEIDKRLAGLAGMDRDPD